MSLKKDRDPLEIFGEWFDEAKANETADPTAVALATADAEGRPSVRMVLLKGWGEDGFVFYTNLESRKARELAENPNAALCFFWDSIDRQVRIAGAVEQVTDEEADAYFASRDRGSRIGAWASKQSRPLESRYALEKEVAKVTAKYPLGEIPRPDFWSGFRIIPRRIEFWQRGAFRLHDRLQYTRTERGWQAEFLYP